MPDDIPGRGEALPRYRVLCAVLAHLDRWGQPPFQREIAAALGMSVSMVSEHIDTLCNSQPPLMTRGAVKGDYGLTAEGERRARLLHNRGRL